jgi:hypothetical protein
MSRQLNVAEPQAGYGPLVIPAEERPADALIAILVLDGAVEPLDAEAEEFAEQVREENPDWTPGDMRVPRLPRAREPRPVVIHAPPREPRPPQAQCPHRPAQGPRPVL